MKIRNPLYLAFALAMTISVAVANHNGWSVLPSLALRAWQPSGPNTQHK
jgi:hypothetical protein